VVEGSRVTLRYLSVCSGIEAATVAWHPLGWQPVATDIKQVQWASGGGQLENDTAQALRSNAEYNYQFARIAMQVRRLTPVECERLQGFPDGYTNIPWRKKDEAPDGPRYKALGNSMAVPCMAWIGQRIAEVDRGD
jgi:DNA (cytosine-5)-methyltransferase 1